VDKKPEEFVYSVVCPACGKPYTQCPGQGVPLDKTKKIKCTDCDKMLKPTKIVKREKKNIKIVETEVPIE